MTDQTDPIEETIAEELKLSAKKVCDALGIKRRVLADDATRMIELMYFPAPNGFETGLEGYGADIDPDLFQAFMRKTWEPAEVQYLLELYKSGKLPMRKKVVAVPAEIEAYAAIPRDELVRNSKDLEAKRAADQEAAAAAKRQRLSNLDAIAEREFTYTFLNEVFSFHFPKGGEETLRIGGIAVRKSLALKRSNSRKTSDWDVTYSWTGGDGKAREIRKESRFSGNRHNDPDRNWGLGRE